MYDLTQSGSWTSCCGCARSCAWYSGCYIDRGVVAAVDRKSPCAVISVVETTAVEIRAGRPRPIYAVEVAGVEACAIGRVYAVPLGEFDE